MGYFRRPRKGPKIRLRPVRCRVAVLQRQQSGVFTQLQAYVVPRDPSVLSEHACAARRLQERPEVCIIKYIIDRQLVIEKVK